MSRYTMGRSVSSSLPLVSQCSVTSTAVASMPSSLSPLLCSSTHSTQYRCEELRVRIHENHLSYLNRDETPAKIEMRNKIECLIAEYLFLVPHSQKFSFIEVSNCLNRSIVENSEFSAYKAANAFEALEKYATNLITLPWRKEYHSLCPYSGFYRHVVQKMLIGAEHILKLMGFVHNSSKGIYQLNDCPIDADRLSRVSLECLVAFVECQIMIQIRESLKAKGYSNCSWREIHAIRAEYVCGQADAIKLICETRKTAKLIDYENTNSNNTPKRLIMSETVDCGQHRNGYSLIDGYLSPQKQFAHIYDEDDSPESFDLLNYPIVDSHSFPITQQQCQYCLPHSNSLPPCPPPPFTYLTPQPMFASFPTPHITPKLQTASKGIQAEMPPLSNGISSSLSKMSLNSGNNKKAVNELNITSNNSSQTRKDSSQSLSNKSNRRGSFYDNLDPINFLETSLDTNLNSCDKKANERKSPPTQERNKQSASSLEKKKPLEKKKSLDCNSISRIVSSMSIKPNSSASKSVTSNNYSSLSNNSINSSESKSLPTVSTVSTNLSSLSSVTTNPTNEKINAEETQREVKSNAIGNNKQNVIEKWSCISCTFLNMKSREICEMCHRSRKSGNEAMPLISGGRECSRCTLVNDKEEKFCRACDTSLADSPTYI